MDDQVSKTRGMGRANGENIQQFELNISKDLPPSFFSHRNPLISKFHNHAQNIQVQHKIRLGLSGGPHAPVNMADKTFSFFVPSDLARKSINMIDIIKNRNQRQITIATQEREVQSTLLYVSQFIWYKDRHKIHNPCKFI